MHIANLNLRMTPSSKSRNLTAAAPNEGLSVEALKMVESMPKLLQNLAQYTTELSLLQSRNTYFLTRFQRLQMHLQNPTSSEEPPSIEVPSALFAESEDYFKTIQLNIPDYFDFQTEEGWKQKQPQQSNPFFTAVIAALSKQKERFELGLNSANGQETQLFQIENSWLTLLNQLLQNQNKLFSNFYRAHI